MRSSQYCPRLKLSFWSCLRDMKERREVEKAWEKKEGRSGALPVTRFIFSELFFTSGRFSRELSERSERIISCLLFSSLYSNLNTLINFRAGHPRKNTIQFTALRKHFPYQLNWTTISSHLKRLPGKQFPLTNSMRIRRFHAYWSIFILKYFLKTYASPLFIVITYCKIRNFFCIVAVLLIFHTSGSKNNIC